jgi:rhomboid protease GluP
MSLSSPENEGQQPVGGPPAATPDETVEVAHPKVVEARAVVEFQARLREVTPRIGVTAALVLANVLIYVAMVRAGVSALAPAPADLVKWGGNYGLRTLGGQPWRIVTAAFLHAGFVHLAMNMFVLWSSGRSIERIFGPARFAAIYLCAAVTGGIASVAVHPQIVGVGASGAVFGLYGALAGFLLRERGGIPAPVISRLGRMAATFVAINVFYGFSQPAIDNSAHLGGLFGGVFAGGWLARPLAARRPLAPMRVVSALAVATVALVGTARLLPTPPDFDAIMHQFGSVEAQTIETYNSLVRRAHDRTLSDDDFASGIERDVLPPWRAARAALMLPRRWTSAQEAVLKRLDEYNRAREQAWVLFVRAGRTKSPEDLAAAKEAQATAKRILEAMNQKK